MANVLNEGNKASSLVGVAVPRLLAAGGFKVLHSSGRASEKFQSFGSGTTEVLQFR
jgi:hypothetical protein